MLIFAGLGNPGAKYALHRHNIGYMVADEIIRRYGFRLTQARHHSYVATGNIRGEKILLLKPKTFMNDSGRAASSALHYYKVKARNVTAIYDELDLVPGKVRVKRGGGAGGHNGIRDLIQTLGSTEFPRLRVGVGNSFPPGGQVDFVLSPFDDAEREAADAERNAEWAALDAGAGLACECAAHKALNQYRYADGAPPSAADDITDHQYPHEILSNSGAPASVCPSHPFNNAGSRVRIQVEYAASSHHHDCNKRQ